jgi:hypothetical protein
MLWGFVSSSSHTRFLDLPKRERTASSFQRRPLFRVFSGPIGLSHRELSPYHLKVEPMSNQRTFEEMLAIDEARWQLRELPIPGSEFDQVVAEVLREHPPARGVELATLLADAVVRQWTSGMKS